MPQKKMFSDLYVIAIVVISAGLFYFFAILRFDRLATSVVKGSTAQGPIVTTLPATKPVPLPIVPVRLNDDGSFFLSNLPQCVQKAPGQWLYVPRTDEEKSEGWRVGFTINYGIIRAVHEQLYKGDRTHQYLGKTVTSSCPDGCWVEIEEYVVKSEGNNGNFVRLRSSMETPINEEHNNFVKNANRALQMPSCRRYL